MMEPDVRARKVKLAFAAGALMLLAGLMELSVGIGIHSAAKPAFIAIGAAFASAGFLWIVVARKWKNAG